MGEWDATGDSDSVTALAVLRREEREPNVPGVSEWMNLVRLIADALPAAYMESSGGAKDDAALILTIVRKKDRYKEAAK